jgi:hypothetical protein
MVLIWHGELNTGVGKYIKIVECLLHSQPSRGIIRTTADYFFLPYCALPSAGGVDNTA